ncbi:hypothetical protein HanXRQr2_Chr16g0768911 [Helianthus annuus]|uniref:Uncharacterized protein n=1 Tax=Helianthus annuus TaxID=4232 RepID=A0A9K3DVG7_HELAN|nr:hypothetical protein HanXRQr2_Chr16g0768911 [Helianthus annuus]KAJ0444681.1 hypothetical protein HanIR_Chr16g0834521 [Helianthus annuus]KAJ0461930.1 hypothetical protein HanHA89_Chr16g0677831 [Helianthus annuus]KAJ0642317.1 hypothetical protein HanLR1_Chr16g0636961 [Helianthus annuus]
MMVSNDDDGLLPLPLSLVSTISLSHRSLWRWWRRCGGGGGDGDVGVEVWKKRCVAGRG